MPNVEVPLRWQKVCADCGKVLILTNDMYSPAWSSDVLCRDCYYRRKEKGDE